MMRSASSGTARCPRLRRLTRAAFPRPPQGSRELYERLKATPLYDPERGQWSSSMSEEERLQETERYAAAQLLGVLVEAKLLSALPHALAEAVLPLPVTEIW